MKVLFRRSKDKRALSNIVAYVLLISITIALSVLVYGWLRFYVSGSDIDTCSDGVNIIIRSYECYEGDRLIINLKNKGLFTVDGYLVRVHNRTGADFGFYLLNDTGTKIAPGVEHSDIYFFNDPSFDELNDFDFDLDTVTFLEVQPFMEDNGEIKCQAYASQKIVCD
jgi:flagellin-like protein